MWSLIKHVNIVSGVKKVCYPKTCRWANTEFFLRGPTEENFTPRYYSAGVSQFTRGTKKAHFLWLGVVQNTRIITGGALTPFSMRVYFCASRVSCTVGSVHVRQLLAGDPGTWSTHTHTHTHTHIRQKPELVTAPGWLFQSAERLFEAFVWLHTDTNWKIFIIMIQHLLPHLHQWYLEWPVFTFYFNKLNVVINN